MREFLLRALASEVAPGCVLGRTPSMGDRGEEVATWLSAHPDVETFVILDDQHRKAFERAGLVDHYVQTDIDFGLTDTDVVKALRILSLTTAGAGGEGKEDGGGE